MAKKRRKGKKQEGKQQEDLMRKVVHGILSLVLGALATWLAAKLTDAILGPVEEEAGEEESD